MLARRVVRSVGRMTRMQSFAPISCIANEGFRWQAWMTYGVIGAMSGGVACAVVGMGDEEEEEEEEEEVVAGSRDEKLADIRLADVRKHKDPSKGPVWVYFKEGVYDITKFVEIHPGGAARIMLAAGGDISPFWRLFAAHNKSDVHAVLEELRIGNLHPDDLAEAHAVSDDISSADPYGKEPERSDLLIVNAAKPFNAETPGSVLVSSFITPPGAHYVRNHLPVPPEVDLTTFRLRVEGPGIHRPLSLRVSDLRNNFLRVSVPMTIQCAGNRRAELDRVRTVRGLGWDRGAIGTSVWTGARLSDILAAAGYEGPEASGTAHVVFEGLDIDPTESGKGYGASIPAERAIDESGDVIIAYEMNGKPIPRDHGFPLRAIVPGVVGARNVKWLSRITTSAEESTSHWQRRDYKIFGPAADWENLDWDRAPSIQDLPVQSAICHVNQGEPLTPETKSVVVRGYAFSGGGRTPIRVDLTTDDGASWMEATLEPFPEDLPKPAARRNWTWRLWEATIPVPEAVRKAAQENGHASFVLAARAADCAGNVQPENGAHIWNARGVLNNAWAREEIKIQPKK